MQKGKFVPFLTSLAVLASYFLQMDFALPAQAAPSVLAPTTIADIAQAVSPAVVNIEVDQMVSRSPMIPLLQIPDGALGNLDFFFNGAQVRPHQNGGAPPSLPKIEKKNTGSGFIIRNDGYILTNSHVVRGASKIIVTLSDGRVFNDAKVVGTDAFTDLAVVKINAQDLPTVKLGTSAALRPGEFTIAIGNPLGFGLTVTFGIVSAVHRPVDEVSREIAFIQTDAAINPGNSGGPLLNLDGEVIGVNTAIYANAQNIGFSIPIDDAKGIVEDLINGRRIIRPWLGISMNDMNEVLAKSLGLPPSTKGILVSQIFDNSPAALGGLQRGDIIEKIDGKDVSNGKEVRDIVRAHKVDDSLNFFLLRNHTSRAVSVKIGTYPDVPHIANDDGED